MLSFGGSKKINPFLKTTLAACRPHFRSAALFSFFINLLYLAPTLYMLQIYDRVVPTSGLTTLLFLSLLLVFALVALSWLDLLRGRILLRSSVRLDGLLSGELLDRLLKIGGGRSRNAPLLDTMREFETFKSALSGPGTVAVFDAPWILIYIALCFLLHPLIGAVALGGSVVLGVLALINERATHHKLAEANRIMNRAYAMQEALASRADVIRALGMRTSVITLQMRERQTGVEDNLKAGLAGDGVKATSKFLRLFLQSLALGLGAWLVINNEITAGAIFAASLLVSRALAPLEQIIGSWRGLVKGYEAFHNINRMLDTVPAQPMVTQLPPPEGVVSVENLTVVNAEERRYFLQDVSFTLTPGEILGVTGPSGAGKTTLARVLAGADPYEHGHVRFDGSDRREWDSERLGRYIGYLPQDVGLFAGSIRDNISRFAYLSDDLSDDAIDEAVVRAAKKARAHDLILQLPHGYNTLIGMDGRGLSAGQIQRIGLARALYGDPKVVILDEPNAHLDAEGETGLIAAMEEVCADGGSVFMIAHRIGVLSAAHRLLTLHNGRVTFFGNRNEWAALQQRRLAEQARAQQLEADDSDERTDDAVAGALK